MASAVFPAPAAASSINASSITATTAFTLYEGRFDLQPAIYAITCTSSTIAKAEFYSGTTTLITTATTVSGTVTVNLGTAADRVRVWTNTGSNIVVTFTKVAEALTTAITGTLDTITASGTYTGTSTSGLAYAVLVGGGGGGGGATYNTGSSGNGGVGGVCNKLVTLTGSMAVTIGTAGVGGSGMTSNGTAGTSSTFASMTAGGGGGGLYGVNGQSAAGKHGTPGTATGGTYNQVGNDSETVPTVIWSFATPSASGVLGVAGIGQDYSGSAAVAATGFGASGAGTVSPGGPGAERAGANGAPGGLLILRF
jgi:hypothetical protein